MKWSIGTKIAAGFGVVLAALLVIGAVSYQSTKDLVDTAERVDQTHIVIEHIEAVISALKDVVNGQRGYVITGDESYLATYQDGKSEVEVKLSALKDRIQDNPKQQERLKALEPLIKSRVKFSEDVIQAQKDQGFDTAQTLIKSNRGKTIMDDIRRLADEMSEEETALLKQRDEKARVQADFTKRVVIIGTLAAFLLSALIAIMIIRDISAPLQEITGAAERIAAGDLTIAALPDRRGDEVGVLSETFMRMNRSLQGTAEVARQIAAGDLRVKVVPQSEKDVLGSAFSLMVGNLQKLTKELTEGANVLGSASSEIVASSSQMAAGATETATAVTETTTTVEEVRQTSQVSSQKAKVVAESAQKSSQIAQGGRKAAEEAIAGMDRIRQQMASIADSMTKLSEQTQTIRQIIATVDDLAAQSNLLAVNASIEAAKAGEYGKGFVVVAQEVRSLAEQSKQATTQVRTILGDIQKATAEAVMATEQGDKAVESGVKQSKEAAESINALANSVTESAQAAAQIAASSQQQLVGVDQVALAMKNVKQASTQNMTSAKQLENSARDLNELGQKMKALVERFKV